MENNMHPSVRHFVPLFAYTHLPPNLQEVSKHFHDLAMDLIMNLPDNPEKSVALRKLLESKDCAVRTFFIK